MMDRDTDFERRDSRVIGAKPFAPYLQRTLDSTGVVQQRRQISPLDELSDLLSVTFDPVGLRRKDQRPLALGCELPRGLDSEVSYDARVGVISEIALNPDANRISSMTTRV